jgi:acyl-CoA hydrolase
MIGLTPARFRRDNAGMVAVDQHVRYMRELHAGDPITIRSAVIEIGTSSMRLQHEMSNEDTGEIAATSTIVGVYIDAGLRQARLLPEDLRERATLILARSNPGSRLPCQATWSKHSSRGRYELPRSARAGWADRRAAIAWTQFPGGYYLSILPSHGCSL